MKTGLVSAKSKQANTLGATNFFSFVDGKGDFSTDYSGGSCEKHPCDVRNRIRKDF
jgi:hypothetical protein